MLGHMSAIKGIKKQYLALAFAISATGMASCLTAMPVKAGQKPLVWSDALSGLAIGGFDPIAYFLHKRPARPQGDIEAAWGGTYWRFISRSNRAAFLEHPHIYAPRFGGFDPYGLARHRTIKGNPVIFAIFKGRLYLFHSLTNRDKWSRHKSAYIIQAKEEWLVRGADEAGLEAASSVPLSSP
jgi:hypothetical protein